MEAPKPIEPDSVFNEDTLYLYGVDYMSTDDIKAHFNSFGEEKNVTWINDSSCRVQFESAEVARRAYKNLSLSTNSDQNTRLCIGEALVEPVEGVDPRNFDKDLGWKEIFGF